jgi:pimeloyl-ACP methyl ester carboxylesterase
MSGQREEIILVHGLWFGAAFMAPMARRLQRQTGLPVRRINYRSTRGELGEHAGRLYDFAQQSDATTKHLVGHSLGGLVILKMLSRHRDFTGGRVVFLGSPIHGSTVARKVRKIPGASALLGKIQRDLEKGFDGFAARRECGMIAGTRPVGLGLFVGGLGGPGDGTVALAETEAGWLRDRYELPLTHTGLIYSRKAAEKTAEFIETGGFRRADA